MSCTEEIEQFSLFRIFESITVADAVCHETTGKHRLPKDVLQHPPFTVQPPVDGKNLQEFLSNHDLSFLHPGETESLYHCGTQSILLFLTEDLAARDRAKLLNITPVGSVGIIVRAYREKRLSKDSAIQSLQDLQTKSSLFVASAIIEQAIEMIHT